MPLKSLKSKLLAGVSFLVICSGVLISLLVTHRYSQSLFDALSGQAEHLAKAVSLQATDMVLINDLVALQKTLDHQLRSNPSLSYLFILKEGQVLAHTFSGGVPVDLIGANETVPGEANPHLREIVSTGGDYYLDLAVPIFDGKAGALRLGFSEQPYREQIQRLWAQMALSTLGILFLALAGSLFFVRRITGPLSELAEAADKVNRGESGIEVRVRGEDEVAVLAGSFNNMVSTLQRHTRRLEEQTIELSRAHQQTRTFCGIVQEIGALKTLREIGSYLIGRFRPIVMCGQMAILLLNESRGALFVILEDGAKEFKEPRFIESFQATLDKLDQREKTFLTGKSGLTPLLASAGFPSPARMALLPLIHENQFFGGLLIACPDQCRCNADEVEVVAVMLDQAAGVIRRALLHEEEIRELQSRLETTADFFGIVARDRKMHALFGLIEDIAPTDASVLIQGESGTGKELIARAIHQQSLRKEKPFVVIDCSAYPATLLESELFGHEKGAFTGAIRQKAGRFEQANGGTVFLDEIGEIPLPSQIKLLRVLQTQKFERVGGEQTLSVDVRIIAATNRNLLDEVKKGAFREDLYYRLNVIPLHLPPLRERRNDIPLLSRHFLNRFSASQGKKIEEFSPEAMRVLLDYAWPGNVRELENSIEHAAVLAKSGRIELAHLPSVLNASISPALKSPTMAENEVKLLQKTMEECGWNKKEAARRLGISRSTLYEKLKKYQVTRSIAH